MQSLIQRRAGKVANSSIRYADVKSARRTGSGSTPWMQTAIKNIPVSVVTPVNRDLRIQAGVFGTLMVFTFASGSSASLSGPYTGPDVPGYILAIGFGASLYFLAKKNVNLGT
jgi:Protein CHAPERONE-LIKE PROTEIN OF POR1-like